MSEKRLSGKVAWVTGSSRGIGRVIADHLAGLGANVAVHGTTPTSTRAFNEADSLEAVAKAMASTHGCKVSPFCGDLTDPNVVKDIVAKIRKEFGRIDILVNNAGGDVGSLGITGKNAGKPMVNDAVFVAIEDVRTILDRNFLTCVLCCREVVPEMIERKSGWVVNIGSISGLSGHSSEAIYASAKAAVHEYTRCLAAFVREHNVRANAIAPGLIVVPRILSQGRADNAPKMTDSTLKRSGYPIEIAKAVEYLVTDNSSYMTGQVLRVDGGAQMWPA